MNLNYRKCPNCGRELQIPEGKSRVTCTHCGRNILVKRRQKSTAITIENLMDLAETASSSGNYQEAYSYYTEIVENEPQNYKAWLGKGEASGWLSSLHNLRLAETVTAVRKAIEYCPEEKRAELLDRSVNVINSIAIAYFNLSMQNFERFYLFDESHQEFINSCKEISSVLLSANECFPKSALLLETVVFIMRDSAKDKDFSDGGLYSTFRPTTEGYKRYADGFINDIVERIGKIDPSYEYQQLSVSDKGKESGCFIATAAIGSSYHPNVVLLRQFRDLYLSRFIGGRFVIHWYNLFSPSIAKIIKERKTLRQAVVITFVLPLVGLAKWVDQVFGNRLKVEIRKELN